MKKVLIALKKLAKGIAFAGVFLLIGSLIANVLVFKQEDGTTPVHNFYSLPRDTVDVLVLGTSHAGMNVSTKTMWDEYGIAGYRFWGSIQPIWSTYYYLLEAVKYQLPKVVVLDAHGLTFQQEYGSYPVQVKNTIGMRLSREKLENIWASVPEGDRAFMLFDFSTYHNRYDQLTQDDFSYFPWDRHQEIQVLSSETTDYIYPFEILDKDASEGEMPLGEKEEKYFRMLLDYCKENGIPLEIVAAPYELSISDQQKFRRVSAIAAEYGCSFTNFNECYRDYGIDPQVDFLDPGHFNKTGMPKYARALAEMLKSKYDLPDRRKDPNHIWNRKRTGENLPAYALTEQHSMDGRQDFFDTGVKLYENPLNSWTLCADFTLPPVTEEEGVVMACFDNGSGKGGLKVSRAVNGDLEISFAGDMSTRLKDTSDRIFLCVIKMGQTMKIYVNGELIENRKLDQSSLLQYDGALMLGCEVDDRGRRMHYGKTTIFDLVVYDTALNEADALAWTPRELPMAESTDYLRTATEDNRIMTLQNRFEGDGEAYVDTGVKLYADPDASFTLLCRLDPEISVGDTVYFSCFSEVPGDYHGLLVRRVNGDVLNIVYGSGSGLDLPLPREGSSLLAIVKDRSAYTVYLNGEKALDRDVASCTAYSGSFLIGCQTDKDGGIFRVSGTTLYNLDIYGGVLPEETILAWDPQPLDPEPKDPGMDVSYKLPASFVGDKKSACVDTGVMLYDNPEKDWTVTFALDQVIARRGSIVSCFDETPGKYRGLLVRQTDEAEFSLVLGTEYVDIEVHPMDQLVMSIVKSEHHYSIYVNGELQAEKDCRIASYLGNMFIGCERNQIGRPFRHSDISVRRLEISNRALDAETVKAIHKTWREDTKWLKN